MALAEGSYTVVYGGDTLEVDVPGMAEGCLASVL